MRVLTTSGGGRERPRGVAARYCNETNKENEHEDRNQSTA
jgi:hypothetical protein